MKKLFIVICIVLMAFVAYAADQAARYSGEKAASGAITAGQGLFYGFLIATDSTTAVTVSIHDNATAASGSEVIPTVTVPTAADYRMQAIYPPVPIRYYNGLYVSISTTDCKYSVYFLPGE